MREKTPPPPPPPVPWRTYPDIVSKDIPPPHPHPPPPPPVPLGVHILS